MTKHEWDHWRLSASARIRAALRKRGVRVVRKSRYGHESGAAVDLLGWAASSHVSVGASRDSDDEDALLDAAEAVGRDLGLAVERLDRCVHLRPAEGEGEA